MNSNGLLAKTSILSTVLVYPQFIYKVAANAVMTIADLYISGLPNYSASMNVYVSKQNIIPFTTDLVLANEQINNYGGTIVVPNLKMVGGESVFVQATNAGFCSANSTGNMYFTIQLRGRTQIQGNF